MSVNGMVRPCSRPAVNRSEKGASTMMRSRTVFLPLLFRDGYLDK